MTSSAPSVPAVAPPPAREDPAVQEARRRQQVEERRARGRAATTLTGPQGVQGTAGAGRKILLGN